MRIVASVLLLACLLPEARADTLDAFTQLGSPTTLVAPATLDQIAPVWGGERDVNVYGSAASLDLPYFMLNGSLGGLRCTYKGTLDLGETPHSFALDLSMYIGGNARWRVEATDSSVRTTDTTWHALNPTLLHNEIRAAECLGIDLKHLTAVTLQIDLQASSTVALAGFSTAVTSEPPEYTYLLTLAVGLMIWRWRAKRRGVKHPAH